MNAVVALKAEHSLTDLLKAADLPRSTFFYHQARLDVPDKHAMLKAEIRRIFDRYTGRYGHRRINDELRKLGWVVSKKTVLKLMNQLKLRCQIRRRKRYNSFKGQVSKTAPDLLKRDFTVTGPNQKWVTDVTEFRVRDRRVYLSTVMDLFGREIIGHTAGISPNLDLTNSSLRSALTRVRHGDAPIVHSDQGFQYQHDSWQRLLRESGAKQSMSRKGNCLDNAVMESFFGHLKDELYCNTTFFTVDALTTAIDAYIDWFNTERAHSTLKGLFGHPVGTVRKTVDLGLA
ncbi:IS3 family transposase [Microbacterium sp. RD06]|uniref:IS3 family transposase n=1 Tax=unclassified Microbacterium TaxID=2609290 RepID=UPI0024693477|nr:MULTISPECIES: IS3 family transposase [unclassified Microbacterium]MDH5135023.1 IS3 family transposase [Microbacterium sp. RD10]MDH5156678.1 IS3 family transposase [Microbacterium sp. RD06]MDH5165975.1 IS3 family transposase [Microbacterium sp. RD02]